MLVVFFGSKTSASTDSTNLSIASGVVMLAAAVALPERTTTSTRSVVVRWRWTVALLLAVMANKQDLHGG